jgi:WD40 repeat protein
MLGVAHQVQLEPYILPRMLRQSVEQGCFLLPPAGDTTSTLHVAISKDCKSLAFGQYDGIFRVWDMETNKVSRFEGHRSYVHAVSFSPDGLRIVSGSGDGTVRVADLKGGVSN